jgi:hypothetical protein
METIAEDAEGECELGNGVCECVSVSEDECTVLAAVFPTSLSRCGPASSVP